MERDVPIQTQVLVRQAYNQLMSVTGGVRRRGQQLMIGAITKAVCNARKSDEAPMGARLLAVNAATGSGKSFAYGLGAIQPAIANGLKVVIATGTVALQEQLFARDLVELQAVIPDMRATIVKGRSRYVCVLRLAEESTRSTPAGELAAELLPRLESGRWNGDIDSLERVPDPREWIKLSNDRDGCVGRKCSRIGSCPYYAARDAAADANVIVTNQDMVLTEIRAGQRILPKLEDTVLIVDEAHRLPEKAIESLAEGHTLDEAEHAAQSCSAFAATVRRVGINTACASLAENLIDVLGALGGIMAEVRTAIARTGKTTEARDEKRPVRFHGGRLPQELALLASECLTVCQRVHKALVELSDALHGDEGECLRESVRERLVLDAGRELGRMSRIVSVWQLLTAVPGPDGPAAKWIELCQESGDLRLCASPVGVGSYLHENLWAKVASSVHLSATLATVGGMEPYLRESGLSLTPDVRTLVVESPFNHAEQGLLIVPHDACNPKDVEGHTGWMTTRLPRMIEGWPEGEGVLVLFASHRQMREVAEAMPPAIKDVLLSQGMLPKRELLLRHEQAIREGRRSVIFGTSSYEEGVDLRGTLCSLVIIAKLQFKTPTDPVTEALKEHMDEQGRSFFKEVAVPAACRRLAQSSGRLLRSEKDRGCIVIADKRLTTTGYGREMLATLPPYRFSRHLEAGMP